MTNLEQILRENLNNTILHTDFLKISNKTKGKVRDIYDLGNELLIITTDRLSAFDVVLTSLPFKGQVLNRLSNFWFENTEHIIKNHILEKPDPNCILVSKTSVLPIEVIIRGFLTGSAYRDYQKGNSISGIKLPDNMKYNQKFDQPLFTPSTKEESGKHDLPISKEEIIAANLIPKPLLEELEEKALTLFNYGQKTAEAKGLIMVDTKYEFGLKNNELVLIDEIHTPDSSRYWFKDTYDELYAKGEEQRMFDKEYVRKWLIDNNYMGNGTPPAIPDQVRITAANKYIELFKAITDSDIITDNIQIENRIKNNLVKYNSK